MIPDAEGFLHPQVDVTKCIQCGLCEKVCPALNRSDARQPLLVYAVQAKDRVLRLMSSSGGIFSLLARQTIAEGGIVFGAAIRPSDLAVIHRSAENEEELATLRGSKYVQSDVGDTYSRAKRALEAGRQVLFSGTPCQIAAFRRVLGREYGSLLCVEVICHAAPSPLAWQKYLSVRKQASAEGRDIARADAPLIERISFRCKNCGWKKYFLSLCFAKDREYLADLRTDSFLRGFQAALYNRPSCHRCMVRELRSGADITIGDYWNVHQTFPGMDDDTGTSVVLINTLRGKRAFDDVKSLCTFETSTYEDVRRTNPSVYRSFPPHIKRERFFSRLIEGENFDRLVVCLLRRPLYRRIGSRVKAFIKRIFT